MSIRKTNAGVMAVIFDEAAKSILLHHRTDNNLWSLPGGSLDFGESLHQAVKREVQEETGLIIEPTRFIGVYSDPRRFIFEYPDGNKVHSVVTAFRCEVRGGSLVRVNEESQDARWFRIGRLPCNIWRMQRGVIADAIRNLAPVVR